MEDLRFYDFNLNLLAIENKFSSSMWNIYFNDIGKAEVHLPYNAKSLPIIFENKYLLMSQGEKAAIVTGKQFGKDCVIYAKTPNWILTRRAVLPFSDLKAGAEALVREKVQEVFGDCENIVLGNECGLNDEVEISRENPESAFDVICDICDEAKGGHRMFFDFDSKKWVFEMLKGKKLETDISESALTAYDTEYVFDIQDYFSCGLFHNEENEESFYDYTACDSLEGIYKWQKVLSSKNEIEAKAELAKNKAEEKILTKVRKLKWGRDYNLGDIITLRFEKGEIKAVKDARIVGVNIWDEAQDSGEQPIIDYI